MRRMVRSRPVTSYSWERRSTVSIDAGPGAKERIALERNLYRSLLELNEQTELEPFLKEALTLVVELVGARQGYIEIRDDADGRDSCWTISHGFTESEIEAVQAKVSSGIIAEALASGHSVDTPSALLDPRFSARESVQAGRIEQVLCVPIGQNPAIGVLYIQGRQEPGPMSSEERALVELAAIPWMSKNDARTEVTDGFGRVELREFVREFRKDGHAALFPVLSTICGTVQLDAEVAMYECRVKHVAARVMHEHVNGLTEKIDARDLPAGARFVKGE